jgi:hypothetical protein
MIANEPQSLLVSSQPLFPSSDDILDLADRRHFLSAQDTFVCYFQFLVSFQDFEWEKKFSCESID